MQSLLVQQLLGFPAKAVSLSTIIPKMNFEFLQIGSCIQKEECARSVIAINL